MLCVHQLPTRDMSENVLTKPNLTLQTETLSESLPEKSRFHRCSLIIFTSCGFWTLCTKLWNRVISS